MHRSLGLMVVALLLVGIALPTSGVHSAPFAAPGQSAFGVNSHIATRYSDPDGLNVPADLLAQAETGWAREDFQFQWIEPQQSAYDWRFHDNAVNALVGRGINIIGILAGPTPAWANPAGSGDGFYPPDTQLFAQFASTIVARYKDRVHYWEIWNEPDNERYWKPSPDPVAYANLLKAIYPAVKGADPAAQVLSAGLVSPEPAVSFLSTIAANGGWNSFDILSIHPYTDPKGPEEGQIGAAGIGQVKALADRLGAKPIWATEFGWATGVGGRGGVAFDEETQANYLVRGSVLLRATGVDHILWYNLKDSASNERYGLLRVGGGGADYGQSQWKPAFVAYRTLNQQLLGATPADMLNLGQQSVVLDFERFGTWRRGDQPNGTFTQSTAQVHSGGFSGQLSYNFPTGGNDYVVFSPASAPTLGGNASQLGVWVYGDGSGHALKVWLRDKDGEVLQFRLGFVGAPGWQFLSTPINGQVEPYNRVSGAGNLRLDLPATLTTIVLDDEPDSFSGSGTIYLDDMTATSGPEAYGVRFSKGGGVVDVLWAPGGGQVSVPTSSALGTLVDRSGGTTAVSSSGGQFAINVGPSPVYLIHAGGGGGGGGTVPPPPINPQPACSGGRTFPETGYSVCGRIREFWEQNGGLPVFGFPIGAQHEEQIEGKPFQVQAFERNRLELHPENQRPYDVLLGRLGADRLSQQGRDWMTFPKSQAQAECRFFPQTGHNVCGEILQAWHANGLEFDGRKGKSEAENLALFGLPLSDEQTETIEGKQYVVQWFERARFERHPENAPPFNVLLGLLGNETLKK
jgi:hypothetical protein